MYGYGGGFWGTPREEAWRRQKEKAYEREAQIRQEGEKNLDCVLARHKQELDAKEHVLDLTRNLLSNARHDATLVKRKQSDQKNPSSANNTAAGDDDDDNRKKRRRSSETEAVSAAVTPEDEDRKPEAVPSVAVMPVAVKPDPCQSTASSMCAVKPDPQPLSTDESTPVPDPVASAVKSSEDQQPSSTNTTTEKDAEESVRESLLALSYAMFDTLHGTKSFQPRAFCEYLVKQGEKALAEQIALAAIEKSHASEEEAPVLYVLNEMVPVSNAGDDLVQSVHDILEDKHAKPVRFTYPTIGKQALIEWYKNRNETEKAFTLSLTLGDEASILKAALPLTTTAARRNALKEACKGSLDKRVIGIFKDEEWPAFMMSLSSLKKEPSHQCYLDYAVNQMTAPANIRIGKYFLEQVLKDAVSKLHPHNEYYKFEDLESLKSAKKRMYDKVSAMITEIDKKLIGDEKTRSSLEDRIGINTTAEIAKYFQKCLHLPPVSECTVERHRTFAALLKCKKCRDMHAALAQDLGFIQALREHAFTGSVCDFKAGVGLNCAPANVMTMLDKARVDAQAATALMGATVQEHEIYCRTAAHGIC